MVFSETIVDVHHVHVFIQDSVLPIMATVPVSIVREMMKADSVPKALEPDCRAASPARAAIARVPIIIMGATSLASRVVTATTAVPTRGDMASRVKVAIVLATVRKVMSRVTSRVRATSPVRGAIVPMVVRVVPAMVRVVPPTVPITTTMLPSVPSTSVPVLTTMIRMQSTA